MNHLGFLALVYLTLILLGLPSPSKEAYIALAYALCCYELEIATALDPASIRRVGERLTTLARSLREIQITVNLGDFAWRWPRQ